MTMSSIAESVGTNVPPQVSFKTVSNAIADFKVKGVLPPKIDKRLWPNYSNTVATQLVATMKFLDLIDDAGVPTPYLHGLMEHHGTEQWASTLELVVRAAYSPVMDIELDKVHGSHLRDKFKDVFGLEGDQQRKAIAFFLFAARDAGMKLSPYLKLRERSPSKGPRKKREKTEELSEKPGGKPGAGTGESDPPKTRRVHEHQSALIEIINTYTDMDDDMRTALLKVVGFIAMKGVTK